MVYTVLCAYEGGEEEQNLCLTWPSIGGAGFRDAMYLFTCAWVAFIFQ